jgi:hypothetical protein
MIVRLTFEEVHAASIAGLRRELKNYWEGVPDLSPPKQGERDGFSQQIFGAIAELAVCKALDRHWSGLVDSSRTKAPDIGGEIDARYNANGRAFVKARDEDGRRIVFVTGSMRELHLYGWIAAEDAKRSEWLAYEGAGYYIVPADHLHPIETLEGTPA